MSRREMEMKKEEEGIWRCFEFELPRARGSY